MISKIINGEEIYFDCCPSCISDNRQLQYCEEAYQKYIEGDYEKLRKEEYHSKKLIVYLR